MIDPASDLCKAYMVSGAESEYGAALVFHFTGRKARNLAWSEIAWVPDLVDWVGQLKVKKLTGDHLWRDRTTTEPEAIESPIGCPQCELWGGEPVTLEREGEEFEACSFCEADDDRHAWR